MSRANGWHPWPRTVFDTPEWERAWSRSTIEKVTAQDLAEPAMFAVEWSPFWGGYQADAEMDPIWDRPLLTVGTLYSFYGPSYLVDDGDAVAEVVARALARADEWDTAGVLVANLPEQTARAWAAVRPPDARARLDIAYWRQVGTGRDPLLGDVSKSVRTDWRRRARRAAERGLQLVEETAPEGSRIEEVINLANTSATRHGWPAVYDRHSAEQVLAIPGSTLIRADWQGQTVAGFLALEHDHTLYLWAGGTHPTQLREVSPYLFVLHELLATAPQRGRERVEFGRGNDAFKRRYGFHGTATWSLWYANRPEEIPRYQARLATLHQRLGRLQAPAEGGEEETWPTTETGGSSSPAGHPASVRR